MQTTITMRNFLEENDLVISKLETFVNVNRLLFTEIDNYADEDIKFMKDRLNDANMINQAIEECLNELAKNMQVVWDYFLYAKSYGLPEVEFTLEDGQIDYSKPDTEFKAVIA